MLENEQEALASICIGHDDETDAVYTALVGLPIYHPYLPDGRDIHFSIIELCYEDGRELAYELKDGLETKPFLTDDDRRFALDCICAAVRVLVDRHQPDPVVMMTITPDLPNKALRKYQRICDALRDVGYDGRRDSSFHGTQIWIMTRITHGT